MAPSSGICGRVTVGGRPDEAKFGQMATRNPARKPVDIWRLHSWDFHTVNPALQNIGGKDFFHKTTVVS